MRGVIRGTCAHCQSETYFDPAAGIGLEAIASSTCTKCGHTGVVITLNIEPPSGAKILDHIPRFEPDARLSARH
ncbi:MAG TPA: hypothetical protein VIL28_17395 [Steroidobacteraceae bacterium]